PISADRGLPPFLRVAHRFEGTFRIVLRRAESRFGAPPLQNHSGPQEANLHPDHRVHRGCKAHEAGQEDSLIRAPVSPATESLPCPASARASAGPCRAANRLANRVPPQAPPAIGDRAAESGEASR